MSRAEVISMIKRNGHTYYKAITLIADFLVISKAEAKRIYQEEFGV